MAVHPALHDVLSDLTPQQLQDLIFYLFANGHACSRANIKGWRKSIGLSRVVGES